MKFKNKKSFEKNIQKKINFRTITLLIIVTVLFTSVGFSAFWQTLNITNSLAEVRLNENVRVTDFAVYSAVRDGRTTYDEYNVDSVMSGLMLPYSDSSVTYKMELTNFIADEFGIFALNNLPSNLEYQTYELVNDQLVDYNLKSKICDSSGACNLGIKKDIYITIKYKDGGYDSSKTLFPIKLGVDFRKYHTVTYTDIINNGYPVGVLSGDMLKVSFVSDVPGGLKIKIDGQQFENYTYVNGVLTIDNVLGNVEIIKYEPVSLVQYLTNLYSPNSKVTNNGITYNVDTVNGIIDDGLGGTIASGGNLRYYGASPKNYIDIGDRDSSGNVILWRIIGLFETKYATDSLPCNIDSNSDGHFDNCASTKLVKVVRNDSIGQYSWDNKPSGLGSAVHDLYGSNSWIDARLMMLLNPGYEESNDLYEYEGSLYWNSKNGKCYRGDPGTVVDCDFRSTGLSSNVHSKIEKVLWNLGGVSGTRTAASFFAGLYSEGWYKYERDTLVYSGRPTEWVGKVGLMYPSDYGYATDLNLCIDTLLYEYNNAEAQVCRTNDWAFNSTDQWFITPYSNNNYSVSYGRSSGALEIFRAYTDSYEARPALYLKADVMMVPDERTTSDGISYYVLN